MIDCVFGSERWELVKNGWMMLKCVCVECGIIKIKFVIFWSGGFFFDVGNSYFFGEMVFKGLVNIGVYFVWKGVVEVIR